MERLVIDDTLPAKLMALRSTVELVDREGHLIAVVHPQYDPALYEAVGDDITEEELERRATGPGPWYTTEEVLEKLRKLA